MKPFFAICRVLAVLVCMPCFLEAQSDQTVGNGVPTAPINFPGSGCTYLWVNNNPSIGLPASGADNIASFIPVNNGTTPITATINATPEPTGQALIANSGDGTVSIINTATGAIIRVIKVSGQPVGVGSSSSLERFIFTDSVSNVLQSINTVNDNLIMEPFDSTPVGQQPWGIEENPNGRYYYVANSGSNTVSVVSLLSWSVLTNIPVGNSPKGLALSVDRKYLYVANSGSNTISVISLSLLRVTSTISVGESPIGINVSPDGKMLYAAEDGAVGQIQGISTLTNAVTVTIPVGNQPTELAITDDSNTIYVTNSGSNTVSMVSATTDKVIGTISVGLYPFGISITPDGSQVYVTNKNSNNVSVISTVSNRVVNTINVGSKPTSFGTFIVGGGSGCSSFPVTVKITVNPGIAPPIIRSGAVTGTIISCAGSESQNPDIQQFSVLGVHLSGDITATAPSGFEVSLSAGSGYGGSVTIPEGATDSTRVFVRSSPLAPAGLINENVVLSTPGGQSVNVTVQGNINAQPTVNRVGNLTVTGGNQTPGINFTGSATSYIWTNDTPAIGLPASGAGDITPFTAINNGTTPVMASVTVTPTYSNVAYVPNFGDGTVSVINVTINAVSETVKLGGKLYAVALSTDGNKLYLSDEYANTVLVVSTTSLSVIATVKVGLDPSCIVVSPDGTRFYVVNSYSNDVMVFNTVDNSLIYDIKVGDNPQAMVLSPDGSALFVTNSISKTITEISTTDGIVNGVIALNATPSGITTSPDGNFLYVSNANMSSISVIDIETQEVTAVIGVGKNPQGLVTSGDGQFLYVVNNGSNSVSVINTADNSVIATIPVGETPYSISITSDGRYLYVPNAGSNNVSIVSTQTNQVVTTLPVGSQPDSFGNFISSNASGCTGPPTTFTITVKPAPVTLQINASGAPAGLNTVYGTPSTTTTFMVSGIKMNDGILVTPPAGFEVSTDDAIFSSTLTVGTGGNIASTTVYIRLAKTTPAGAYSGNIVLSSTGAKNVDVAMPASTVTPADLTITADDKSKIVGQPNPVLTASYTGFQNSDSPASLTEEPVLNTTATVSSPVGQYPINVSGALSPDYTITYVPGLLTVTLAPATPQIPNAFTPNGDGVNDKWDIKFLDEYGSCRVNVFNRWGLIVYSSIGYSVPWDGTYKGSALPSGTYYYIITLQTGAAPLSGFVAIIR